MLKKCLSLALSIVMLHVGVQPLVAASREDNSAVQTNKVKADIAKRGIGEKATVRVLLRDKRELKGYIAEASENGFVLNVANVSAQNESMPIAYSDVTKVKSGQPLTSGLLFWIGAGAVVTGTVATLAFGSGL